MTLGVVVVDDQSLVRAGFSLLLSTASDMTVLGEAANGADAVAVCRRTRPDVVLMDVRMPGMDGIDATRALLSGRSPEPRPRVIMLTTFDLDGYVYEAIRAGASGFLLKDTRPEHLLDGIRTVAAGDALLSPQVTRKVLAHFTRLAPRHLNPERTADLTAREAEVLVLIARGRSNQEISAELHISMGTTKTHIGHLLTKLNARDRAQLVIYAYENGLVTRASVPPQAPPGLHHGR